jgi:pyruvate,orthophosphate dikinase
MCIASAAAFRTVALLGGKGANLAEMAAIGLPVPPGFTISTEMCARYYDAMARSSPSLRDQVANGIAHIEATDRRCALAMPPIRCWSRCARARGFRCRE